VRHRLLTREEETAMSQVQLDPSHILQVGMGFWPSKTVLSAVELELFTHLGTGAMTGEEVGERISLHPRAIHDFLDTLVALRLLERDGDGSDGRYRNTPETAAFLDKKSPTYVGGDSGDVQRTPVSILGRSHRSTADRAATERDQADGQADVRRALQRPGQTRAIHERDAGDLARQLPRVG
jgi:hypothetical protein